MDLSLKVLATCFCLLLVSLVTGLVATEAVIEAIAPHALLQALLDAEEVEDSPPEVDYTALVEEDKTIQESLALIAQIRARKRSR